MKKLMLMAALAAPAFMALTFADNGSDTSGGSGSGDLPLEQDIAEIEREAQLAVDGEIKARAALEQAIARRVDVYNKIGEGAARAKAFIDAYVNPAQPNPEPIAPDVAEPAPATEPPVYTDVSTPGADVVDTTGGVADVAIEGAAQS